MKRRDWQEKQRKKELLKKPKQKDLLRKLKKPKDRLKKRHKK